MRNILLTISYDGTRFHGWQKQIAALENSNAPQQISQARTVQGEIERALGEIHCGKKISVHQNPAAFTHNSPKNAPLIFGSGRTDSGVHAAAQAANFFSPNDSIPVEKYPLILNNVLPRDIRIHAACEKPQDFHARFNTVNRTYRYFIRAESTPAAFEAPFVWHIRKKPRIEKLNALASLLAGEIDCTTFAAAGDESKSKFRYIEKAIFFPQGSNLVFEICANAFLWKMVRSLTGTLIQFEREGKSPAYFKEVLDSHDRCQAGVTAPPTGLFLWHVNFDGTRKEPK